MTFTPFSIESLYPTPQIRIENPKSTVYQLGDVVKILIGPAVNRYGRIVVERNGNYADYEPYCDAESIGVAVSERMVLEPTLEKIITQLNDPEVLVHSVVRWFDDASQLELIKHSNP